VAGNTNCSVLRLVYRKITKSSSRGRKQETTGEAKICISQSQLTTANFPSFTPEEFSFCSYFLFQSWGEIKHQMSRVCSMNCVKKLLIQLLRKEESSQGRLAVMCEQLGIGFITNSRPSRSKFCQWLVQMSDIPLHLQKLFLQDFPSYKNVLAQSKPISIYTETRPPIPRTDNLRLVPSNYLFCGWINIIV